MNDDLKLGLQRLAQRLEDPLNLWVAVALLWAIWVWIAGVASAMSFLQVLLLFAAGCVALAFARREIAATAMRMRESREALERREDLHRRRQGSPASD